MVMSVREFFIASRFRSAQLIVGNAICRQRLGPEGKGKLSMRVGMSQRRGLLRGLSQLPLQVPALSYCLGLLCTITCKPNKPFPPQSGFGQYFIRETTETLVAERELQ